MPPFNIIILYHIIINMGMLAAGIEPTKPQQAKKGATCAPLVFNILAMRKAATCSSLLHLRIFRKTQTCSLQKCARL